MKTIFTLHIDNMIDLVTNSSSELFILKGDTKQTVEELLASIYPGYLSEYDEVKSILNLSTEELNIYFRCSTGSNQWPCKKEDYSTIPGFTFDDLYEPEKEIEFPKEGDFRYTGNIKRSWDGEIEYALKNNDINGDCWGSTFVTEKNKDSLIEKLDPNHNMWFLFSKDENPNWEMQKVLSEVAQRYHLG